jgi:peptidylprolyl isomerase
VRSSAGRQVISGMEIVDNIKKEAKEDNAAVTGPEKIVKMQLAAEAPSYTA